MTTHLFRISHVTLRRVPNLHVPLSWMFSERNRHHQTRSYVLNFHEDVLRTLFIDGVVDLSLGEGGGTNEVTRSGSEVVMSRRFCITSSNDSLFLRFREGLINIVAVPSKSLSLLYPSEVLSNDSTSDTVRFLSIRTAFFSTYFRKTRRIRHS